MLEEGKENQKMGRVKLVYKENGEKLSCCIKKMVKVKMLCSISCLPFLCELILAAFPADCRVVTFLYTCEKIHRYYCFYNFLSSFFFSFIFILKTL